MCPNSRKLPPQTQDYSEQLYSSVSLGIVNLMSCWSWLINAICIVQWTTISSCSFSFYFLECFLSGETVHFCPEKLSTDSKQSSGLLLLFSTIQPWGWIYNWLRSGSQIKASPGLDIKLAHYYCLRKQTVQSIQVRVPETILQTVKFRF